MVKEKLVGIINIPFSINKLRATPRTQKWFKFDQLPSVNSPSEAEILLDINFITNQPNAPVAAATTTTTTSSSLNESEAGPLLSLDTTSMKKEPVLGLSMIVQSPDLLVLLMDFLESKHSLKYLKFWMGKLKNPKRKQDKPPLMYVCNNYSGSGFSQVWKHVRFQDAFG